MRRVELLLTEMQDKYVRENIRRIKGYLQSLEERVGEGSSTTNITNNFSSSIWSREITEVRFKFYGIIGFYSSEQLSNGKIHCVSI